MLNSHIEIEIEVPFHDVDSMGIVWHGHYVKYLELARCALLDDVGFGYRAMAASAYGWPVIELKTRYIQAAEFGQRLTVRATLKEWDMRLKIDYLITDKLSGRRVNRASTVQVPVDRQSGEMVMPLPADIQAVFAAYQGASQ